MYHLTAQHLLEGRYRQQYIFGFYWRISVIVSYSSSAGSFRKKTLREITVGILEQLYHYLPHLSEDVIRTPWYCDISACRLVGEPRIQRVRALIVSGQLLVHRVRTWKLHGNVS